jgi:DNA-binding NtrC family response regulator
MPSRLHHARVLVADDQGDVRDALRLLLAEEGHEVLAARSPAEVMTLLAREPVDVLLMDMNYARDTTSGREGLDLLARVRAHDAALRVVVLTAWGSVAGAVASMRLGAADYVEKPWDDDRLLAIVRAQAELARAHRANQRLTAENRRLRARALPPLVAESPAMQRVLALLERVAPSDANVLVTGEHGTGKDVVARWLHAASARADQPFVVVNAGGVAESVFESELFGHVKGAFTDARADRVGHVESADGGTLFLDEIANLAPRLQATLLRVLQTGEFQRVGESRLRRADVRVVSATNADLRAEIAAGRFREDLLYRLNTVELKLPPLRERPEDVAPLAELFLRRYAQRYGRPLDGFDAGALRALRAHRWPGNVRELQHAVERAVLLATGAAIGAADLALDGATTTRDAGAGVALADLTLAEAAPALIRQAVARHGGNVNAAAAALGLSRSALYRRLQADATDDGDVAATDAS